VLATLIALPILTGLLVLQTTILSKFPLLHGTADLVLLAVLAWALQKQVKTAWQWGIIAGLLVGIASAQTFVVSVALYIGAVGIALLLRQRVWQVPSLAMLIATFAATLFFHGITIATRRLAGTTLPLQESLNLVTLPSMLLNLLLAVPVFAVVSDLAKWIYPEQLDG
jgi:rod shape-determining protein MreD